MAQPSRGLRFLIEALHEVFVCGELGAQHFDRDLATQQEIVPAIDDGHAAFADLRVNTVPVVVYHAPESSIRRVVRCCLERARFVG
jgi:hypothetical protein